MREVKLCVWFPVGEPSEVQILLLAHCELHEHDVPMGLVPVFLDMGPRNRFATHTKTHILGMGFSHVTSGRQI